MKQNESHLLVDSFDPEPILADLRKSLAYALGPVGYFEVREALKRAFSRAEGAYIDRAVKQAQESSGNMLHAVLAGMELRDRDIKKKSAS